MAAVSVSQTLREDFLTCKVCLNIFQSPKVLPCLHTYCKRCISQLIERTESDSFQCPECRRPTFVKDRDPDTFQTNFFVSGLLEAFTVDRCSVCKLRGANKSASHQCIDCGDSLCESCSAGHLASRSTVNHRVVTLEDVASGMYDQEIQKRKQMFCEEHSDQECAIYCKTCKKAMCVSCALVVHREHDLSSLEDGSTEAQGTANSILQKSQDVLKRLGSLWSRVQKQIKETQERQQGTLSELEIATEQIIQAIIAQKEDTLKRLKEAYEGQLNQYATLKEEIDAVGKTGRKMVDSVQVIVSKESGSQMLLLNETLKHGLVQLEDSYQTLSQKCVSQPQLAFTVNTAICQSPIFSVCKLGESADLSLSRNSDQLGQLVSNSTASDGVPSLTVNETVNPPKYVSVSPVDLESLYPQSGGHALDDIQIDHTATLKHTLQNFRILDPPSVEDRRPSPLPLPIEPAVRSYSDALKHPSMLAVAVSKAPKVSLTFKSKVDLSVKKDTADPEISGLAFFGHDRILVTDKANKKVKSFLKDGSIGFVKEFKADGYAPSSVTSIKDVIAFTLQNVAFIVTKQYVPIAKVHLGSCVGTADDVVMFPLCRYDEESFLISNLQANKQWVIKISGEVLQELQCPVRSPVVAVSRDAKLRYYLSSWGQPGSVVVVEANLKRLMVLQPLCEGQPVETWYPGYSACDNAGNIFVADPYQDQIIVFSQWGRPITGYNTRADGLTQPMCLIIDKSDLMFVTGKNKEAFTYKIKRRNSKITQ